MVFYLIKQKRMVHREKKFPWENIQPHKNCTQS